MYYVVISGDYAIGSSLSAKLYSDSEEEIIDSIEWHGDNKLYSFTPSSSTLLSTSETYFLGNTSPRYIKAVVNGSVFSDTVVIGGYVVPQSWQVSETQPLTIVGSGISYEKPISAVSGLSTQSININRINQSLRLILSTAKGEFPMLPNFGTNLHKIVLFSNMSETGLESIRQDLLSELSNQEPRAQIQNIDCSFDYDELTLKISIEYSIIDTYISGNLIYNKSAGGVVSYGSI